MKTEDKYIDKIIKTHDEIVEQIKKVAKKLNAKFKDSKDDVIFITIMKGGLPFSLELVKHLNFDLRMDFLVSSSYYLSEKIENEPKITFLNTENIRDKDVIIADDLIDSGETMLKVVKILKLKEPKSITLTGVYGKPTRKKTEFEEIFCWEEDPEGFLMGFGLDYDEKYRNLPYIAIIKKDNK